MNKLIHSFAIICLLNLMAYSAVAQKLDNEVMARNYLENNFEKWNLVASDVRSVRLNDSYVSNHNEITHTYFNQTYQHIPVYNALAGVHLTADGKVVYATNTFIRDLSSKINTTIPQLTPHEAIALAAINTATSVVVPGRLINSNDPLEFHFEGGEVSNSDIIVKLKFQPILQSTEVRLVWQLTIDHKKTSDLWLVHIDAQNGDLLKKHNLTIYCQWADDGKHDHDIICLSEQIAIPEFNAGESFFSGGTYNVVPFPAESPIHGEREILSSPADPLASPFGWHDTDGIEGAEFEITRGNNAHAYLDTEQNDASLGDEPNGGSELNFDFPFDQSLDPEGYQEAAVTQLFYAVNYFHDFIYHYGFDEAAGNFQAHNYTGEGYGNDHVRAEAQDGMDTNNANFATPSDGAPGRMQMYIWNALGGKLLSVVEPLDIAGEYSTGQANYGPELTTDPIIGEVVEAFDDSGNPSLGCETIINVDEVNGKVAMINRGDCLFEEKTLNAEAAGAIAVIICNYAENATTMGGGVGGQDPGIPSVMLKNSDCQLLRQYMDEGVTVSLAVPEDGGPNRLDASFDNGVIVHEYGHGVSNRLTGGPSMETCLENDEQMGEGWSDFFTLVTTVKSGDVGTTPRGIGNYVTKGGVNGGGIRRLPYTTNMNINNQTYDDIIGTDEPHPVGEIWTDILWDLYWEMVDVYGFDEDPINGTGGNNMAIQLVVDGMKYQSCEPGFIAGRDAILVADAINNDGANECLIWEVFARRGVGINADGGSVYSRNDGEQDFEVFPECIKELKIAKTVTPLIKAGENITVTINVDNHKETATTGVIVTDEIQEGTAYINGSATGAIPELTGNVLSFDLGEMEAGASVNITYELSTVSDLYSEIKFHDGMENGDGYWLFDNLEGSSIWDISADDPYEGEFSWFVPSTELENDQVLFLLDPMVVTGDQPVLRFFHKYDTEPGIDGGIVEISADGGESWDIVNDQIFKNPYRGAVSYLTFGIPGVEAYWGNSNGYKDTYIDLMPYQGEYILVRFRFASDEEDPGVIEEGIGWYVDNIEIIDMHNYHTEACVSSNEGDMVCTTAPSKGTIVDEGDPTSIKEEFAGDEFTVYPNPASESVNIIFSTIQNAFSHLEVITCEGRILKQEEIGPGHGRDFVLNISEIPSGLYFVRVYNGKGYSTQKLIIN